MPASVVTISMPSCGLRARGGEWLAQIQGRDPQLFVAQHGTLYFLLREAASENNGCDCPGLSHCPSGKIMESIGTLVGLVCGAMDSHYLWGCPSGLGQMEKALDGKKVRMMIASARRAV